MGAIFNEQDGGERELQREAKVLFKIQRGDLPGAALESVLQEGRDHRTWNWGGAAPPGAGFYEHTLPFAAVELQASRGDMSSRGAMAASPGPSAGRPVTLWELGQACLAWPAPGPPGEVRGTEASLDALLSLGFLS